MALIIEDGTKVANANSYQDVPDFKTFAKLRGVDIAGKTDPDIEVLLIKAMDFIEAKRDSFQGYKTHSDQELQWPRTDVIVDNLSVDSASIPREVRYAQLQLAIEAMTNDLQPNRMPDDKGPVVSKEVGPIKIAYSADKPSRNYTPAFAKAEALLSHVYKQNGLLAIRT